MSEANEAIDLRDIYTYPNGTAKRILWELLAERPAHANISHKARPSYEEHVRFVESKPYRAWYIINADVPASGFDKPFGWQHVGAIYASKRNEIGIAIFNRFHRRGYAEFAIRLLVQTVPPLAAVPGDRTGYYVANVAPENEASHALFESLGCTLTSLTYRFPERIL